MNFANVAAVTIPQGSVNRISQGGTVLWEKRSETRYTFTVQAANSLGTDSKEFTLTVKKKV